MPKLFAARWPNGILSVRRALGICLALLLVAGTLGFATALSGRPASDTAVSDDYAGERRQLLFFKAAVGRIDEELRHRGSAATPSLQSERESVLRRMREVASRVPPERLPPEVAAMLPPAPVAAAADAPVRLRERPAPKAEVRELRTGLGIQHGQADNDFSSLVLDRPPPLPVYVERRRAEPAREGEPAADKQVERPARDRPAKDPAKEKDRAAAENPVKEPPPTDRAAKERPPAERVAADRPPVTVERSAVMDQRQPAR